MRKQIIATALSAALSGPVHSSGIPVFDAAANVQAQIQQSQMIQQLQHHLTEIGHMVEQVAQLKAQYDQMVALYESLKSGRFLDAILNNPILRENLPPEYHQLYDVVNDGANIVQSARDILGDAEQIIESESFDGTIYELESFVRKRQQQLGAVQKATAERGHSGITMRLEQINELARELSRVSNPGEIAYMQAQIQTAQAQIQNEHNRLLLIRMSQQSEELLLQEQRQELYRRHIQGNGVAFPTLRLGISEGN